MCNSRCRYCPCVQSAGVRNIPAFACERPAPVLWLLEHKLYGLQPQPWMDLRISQPHTVQKRDTRPQFRVVSGSGPLPTCRPGRFVVSLQAYQASGIVGFPVPHTTVVGVSLMSTPSRPKPATVERWEESLKSTRRVHRQLTVLGC